MTDEHRMEQLSRAYVHAVAAVSGCTWARPEQDYGFDLTLRPTRQRAGAIVPCGRSLDLQLKSTMSAGVIGDQVVYDLSVRAYNMLRQTSRAAPALLVLLLLPSDQNAWIDQNEDRLELRRCAYWLSLRGQPSTTNTSTVRVRIPRGNQFTPDGLTRIMVAIQREEDL